MNSTSSTAVNPAVAATVQQQKPTRPDKKVKPGPAVKMGDRVTVQGSNQTAMVTAIAVLPTGTMADITWENGNKGRMPVAKLSVITVPAVHPAPVAALTGKTVVVAPMAPKKDPKFAALEGQLKQAQAENGRLQSELKGLQRGGNQQQLAELQYQKKQLTNEKAYSKVLEGKNLNLQAALEKLGLNPAAVDKIAKGEALTTDDIFPLGCKDVPASLAVLAKK